MIAAFIPPLPQGRLRSSTFLTCPLHVSNCRQPSRTPTMKTRSKGFGSSKSPKKANKEQSPTQPPAQSERPKFDSSYVPRGPTMRQEFERKGYIEKQVDADSGVLPDIVANRMIRRILTFGGIPFALLFVFFAVYFVLKYRYDITVIPLVVAYSTLGTIGLATFGITYGIFSSSWDEEDEGSALGWKEAQVNLVRAKDGLTGAREKEIREEKFDSLDKLNEYRRSDDE